MVIVSSDRNVGESRTSPHSSGARRQEIELIQRDNQSLRLSCRLTEIDDGKVWDPAYEPSLICTPDSELAFHSVRFHEVDAGNSLGSGDLLTVLIA